MSYTQATEGYGRRWNAEKAYLRPIRHRPNLIIRTNALVSKVLIDNTNTAYGVEYIKNRRHRTVFAAKEVILSAGSQNTPQILMLSGIGPADHLSELGMSFWILKSYFVGENEKYKFLCQCSCNNSVTVVSSYKATRNTNMAITIRATNIVK